VDGNWIDDSNSVMWNDGGRNGGMGRGVRKLKEEWEKVDDRN